MHRLPARASLPSGSEPLFEGESDRHLVPHGFGHAGSAPRYKTPVLHGFQRGLIEPWKTTGLRDAGLLGEPIGSDQHADHDAALFPQPTADCRVGGLWIVQVVGVT